MVKLLNKNIFSVILSFVSYQNVSYIGVMSSTHKFVVDIAQAEETTMKTEVACSSMSVIATKTKAPDLGHSINKLQHLNTVNHTSIHNVTCAEVYSATYAAKCFHPRPHDERSFAPGPARVSKTLPWLTEVHVQNY